MKKTGIICAADTEVKPFLDLLQNEKITRRAMLTFHEGTIGNARVVVLYSGVCRVNAAIAAELLIEGFHVDAVINAGTAGGMDDSVRIFDTVVAEQCAYHDMEEDILTEFHPWMPSVYFPSDEGLLAKMREYAKETEHSVLFGKIVTGERFIVDRERAAINEKYAPLAVDMETAGVAHVCYVNQIPFLAVRTVTDTADHAGEENFEKNCERASEISCEIVAGLLQKLL